MATPSKTPKDSRPDTPLVAGPDVPARHGEAIGPERAAPGPAARDGVPEKRSPRRASAKRDGIDRIGHPQGAD